MKLLGIRFCAISDVAQELIDFLDKGLGMQQMDISAMGDEFVGGIFPAGESWVEIWESSKDTPAGVMLQIVVDDADAWAENARKNGLDPIGPTDAHGERIYFLEAPGNLPMSFQSKLK